MSDRCIIIGIMHGNKANCEYSTEIHFQTKLKSSLREVRTDFEFNRLKKEMRVRN